MDNKQNPLGVLMQEAMGKVREMVDANTIVGQPIQADGVTLIPISKVSFGFGGGGAELYKKETVSNGVNLAAGLGSGVKITPVAFLVLKDGTARVLPVAVPASTTLDRIVEMVPDMVDKVTTYFEEKKQKDMEREPDEF